jgi:hypothetical protein
VRLIKIYAVGGDRAFVGGDLLLVCDVFLCATAVFEMADPDWRRGDSTWLEDRLKMVWRPDRERGLTAADNDNVIADIK